MQALHEMCERRSAAEQPRTEAMKIAGAERQIMGIETDVERQLRAKTRELEELEQKYRGLVEEREKWKQEYMGEFPTYSGPPPESEAQKELRLLKKTEDEIMGIPERQHLDRIDAMKYAADGEASALSQSDVVQKKAAAYRMTMGRSPTAKEIQKWMGSK